MLVIVGSEGLVPRLVQLIDVEGQISLVSLNLIANMLRVKRTGRAVVDAGAIPHLIRITHDAANPSKAALAQRAIDKLRKWMNNSVN
jgi:hypothetical protein